MSIKVKDKIKYKNVSLPIIADLSVGFIANKNLNVDKIDFQHCISNFYQTNKMVCYSFYKPRYILKKND